MSFFDLIVTIYARIRFFDVIKPLSYITMNILQIYFPITLIFQLLLYIDMSLLS